MNNRFSYCMSSSPINGINRIASVALYPGISLLFLGSGLLFLVNLFDILQTGHIDTPGIARYVIIVSFCIAVGIWFLSVAKAYYLFEHRKFRISAEGLEVTNSKTAFLPWDKIPEVAIMHFGAVASRDSSFTVICCFFEAAEVGCKRKMLDYFYGVKNTDRFVLIDYNDAVMEQIRQVYPGQVYDYRAEQIQPIRKQY